jgi:hypothetical protein
MTKDQSLTFRFLLFLAGAGILVLAFFLLNSGKELSNVDIFIWISLGVMYLVAACPFFFSLIRVGNFSGRIPSFAVIWFGIFLYIPASILLAVLLKLEILLLNPGILIQAGLFFLFLVDVYAGFFASSHAAGAAAREDAQRQYLREIKQRAASLALKAGGFAPEYGAVQKSIKQASFDVSYIPPLDGGKGTETEQGILSSLKRLEELCLSIAEGGHPAGLEDETKKLELLIKERKLLRDR